MKVFFTLLCFVTLVFASVLTPQQAFKLTQNADTQGVFVRIELANGIFLYKNRLKVLLNGDDITAYLNLKKSFTGLYSLICRAFCLKR